MGTFGTDVNPAHYLEVQDPNYIPNTTGHAELVGATLMVRPAAGTSVPVVNADSGVVLTPITSSANGYWNQTWAGVDRILYSKDGGTTFTGGPLLSKESQTQASKLGSASGTPSATTFLRGDNTWATPAGSGGGSIPSTSITDSTTTGRSLLTAADAGAGRTALGLPSTAPSTTGSSVLTAGSQAAARTAIGALGLSDVAGYATKTGSVTQFADVSTAAPDDEDGLTWDSTAGQYVPTDLSTRFAATDADGRITQAAQPRWYVPTVVVDEGGQPPTTFPVGGIVWARPAAASLVPTAAGSATTQASPTLAVTTTQDFAVGDVIGVVIGATGEVTLPTTYTFAFSAGAGTRTAAVEAHQTGSTQTDIQYVRVTTAIPSGSTVTITANQNRVIAVAQLLRLPNLVTTGALDATVGTQGGASSPLALSVGPTAATAQANELALAAVTINPGTAGVTRTVTGTNGWANVATVTLTNSSGNSARAIYVVYKVLSATGPVTATLQVTSSDGSNAGWSGAVATFKAA